MTAPQETNAIWTILMRRWSTDPLDPPWLARRLCELAAQRDRVGQASYGEALTTEVPLDWGEEVGQEVADGCAYGWGWVEEARVQGDGEGYRARLEIVKGLERVLRQVVRERTRTEKN